MISTRRSTNKRNVARALAALAVVLTSCTAKTPTTKSDSAATAANTPLPEIALLPIDGNSSLDQQIVRCQRQVRTAADPGPEVEKLGWLFVAKARATFDPGYYTLAENCATNLQTRPDHRLDGLLLHGHVLQNLHRFKDAEPLARELVARRGRSFDFGLLGDVLMEQGFLTEAIDAYQRMMDLKPDLQAYLRAAHVRWLKGDLPGAIEITQMAVQAATPKDPETGAWVFSRMAFYQFQLGEFEKAAQYCRAACAFQPDYPPALLLRGRLLLAQGSAAQSVELLRRAAALNPVPEYQWTLLEALETAHESVGAAAVKRALEQTGAATDPRTFALFLATRNEQPAVALRLAKAELQTRADVFTFDALARAHAAAGSWSEAQTCIHRALAEGTQDARLFLHAGIIAAESGNSPEAAIYLRRASALQQTLLPSEKSQLQRYLSNPPVQHRDESNLTQNTVGNKSTTKHQTTNGRS